MAHFNMNPTPEELLTKVRGLFPNLPYNFLSERSDERLIRSASGWLIAAHNELPAVRKVIERTQSRNGVGSPYTSVSLRHLIKKFPSPGRLERKLWATRERAEAILSSYEGQTPSWGAIANALLSEARIGKAAVMAVADSLFPEEARAFLYRDARESLVHLHSCSVHQPDGLREQSEPLAEADGFRLVLGVEPLPNGRWRNIETMYAPDGSIFWRSGYERYRGRMTPRSAQKAVERARQHQEAA